MTAYSPPPPVYRHDSGLAITSLVAGILGWTVVPTIGAIVAIITGHLAKSEIRKSNGSLGGDGMAQAGLILGYAHLAVFLCVCLLVASIWALGLGAYFLTPSTGR